LPCRPLSIRGWRTDGFAAAKLVRPVDCDRGELFASSLSLIFDNLENCKSGILTEHAADRSAQAARKGEHVLVQDSNCIVLRVRFLRIRYFQWPSPATGNRVATVICVQAASRVVRDPVRLRERSINVAKLLRAYGGCLGIRRR
jgi:hypothetical protein